MKRLRTIPKTRLMRQGCKYTAAICLLGINGIKIIGKWMPFGVSFSPGSTEGAIRARARLSAAEW